MMKVHNLMADGTASRFRFGTNATYFLGLGTGSATPLAWSMAQFLRLAINIESGHNTDTPAIVTARYLKRR